MTEITKRDAKKALGCDSDADLARYFSINRWAVGQWGDDDAPLPKGRQWELQAKRPDLFPTSHARTD